jgi:hypothetical protein
MTSLGSTQVFAIADITMGRESPTSIHGGMIQDTKSSANFEDIELKAYNKLHKIIISSLQKNGWLNMWHYLRHLLETNIWLKYIICIVVTTIASTIS